MPTITTIAEYTRGEKTFPIGTQIDVSFELAAQLSEAGICEPIKGTKKTKKKSKKIEENGSN